MDVYRPIILMHPFISAPGALLWGKAVLPMKTGPGVDKGEALIRDDLYY